jgi:hypothetical protein
MTWKTFANVDLQSDSFWVPQAQTCIRAHNEVALLNNSLLLGSEVFLLLLTAVGIYVRNPGFGTLKMIYREVRDHHSDVGPWA